MSIDLVHDDVEKDLIKVIKVGVYSCVTSDNNPIKEISRLYLFYLPAPQQGSGSH